VGSGVDVRGMKDAPQLAVPQTNAIFAKHGRFFRTPPFNAFTSRDTYF
jgi:hypothetical protein